ncbi:MAG: enolase C-terminal domain-like protein [Desulfobacteraceae bacterium]|nr:enolase C-terminal domain-like protein [Desulfobacteraceae bacterium]
MLSPHQSETRILNPIRIRCYHFEKAFRITIHSPQTIRRQADSVIVRIDFDDGTFGFGESAPRSYVTGETCHSVTNLIVDRFAPILFNNAMDSLESIQSVLNRLEKDCRHHGILSSNSAIGAIDLALLDALRRTRANQYRHLFPIKCRDTLRFSLSVPLLPLEVIKQYLPRLKSIVDIAVIKILVSEDLKETYERIALLRHLADPNTELRLEFNGKMTFSRVKEYLEFLTPLALSAVEEPLPAKDLHQLHLLREQFELNFIADESLISLEDAKRLAEDGTYTIFNIKVSKCGGLQQSLKIAKLAEQHGIQCHVGTHVGESEVLGIAGRQLARSLPNFDCYGGGSEVLFSQLFESSHQVTEGPWQPKIDHDLLDENLCLDLISKCRLLADSRSVN